MEMYLLATFLLKFIVILLVSICFYQKKNTFAEAFTCGWVIVYVFQIALMLFLSCFTMLNRKTIGLTLILLVIILLYLVNKKITYMIGIAHRQLIDMPLSQYVIWGGMILLSIYIMGHNIHFYDSTWDAHTYGLPRIEMFIQKESLFVNMKTEALNIFCNEWNGEINGIFYGIMGGNNQCIFWGNAEIFIYSFVVVDWFCNKIGINRLGRNICLLFYCGMPIVVLLAMTLKGDLLAITLFLLSLGWLIAYLKDEDNNSLFFLIISLGLLAGTKISMLPFVGLCTLSILLFYIISSTSVKVLRLKIVSAFQPLFWGVILAAVGCFRYILNFVFYGDFFQRVGTEKINISWGNFKTSLTELIKTLFLTDNVFTHTGNVDVLNLDLGIIGIPLVFLFPVLLVGFVIYLREKKSLLKMFFILMPSIGSFIFFMCSTYWFPWSFRYYAPWICAITFVLVGILQKITVKVFTIDLKKIFVAASIWMGIIAIYSTIALSMKYGEVTHGIWEEAKDRTLIEREYAFHPYLLESYDGTEDVFDFFTEIKTGKKVLVCNAIDSAISYLFGENNSNDITFCIPSELGDMINEEEWDVISVSDSFMSEDIEMLMGERFSLYRPAKDILAAHVYIRKN